MKFFTATRAKVSSVVGKQLLNWEKRSLEGRLTSLVDIMNGHKEAGLASGHLYYRMLWKNTQEAIDGYIAKADLADVPVTYNEIALGVPALREMQALAEGVVTKSSVKQTIASTIIGICAVFLASPIVFGVWHDLYLIITHPVNHWLMH